MTTIGQTMGADARPARVVPIAARASPRRSTRAPSDEPEDPDQQERFRPCWAAGATTTPPRRRS